MSEPTDEEMRAAISKSVQPYCGQINDTPALLSLLYDIDLMPEQIRLPVNVSRMIAVCELFKRLTPEALEDLLKAGGGERRSVAENV